MLFYNNFIKNRNKIFDIIIKKILNIFYKNNQK